MTKFLELLWKYMTLPFTLLWTIVLEPFFGWVGRSWHTFSAWVERQWGGFLNALPNAIPVLLGLVVLVVTILELVGEGWLLRRIGQIRHTWRRRLLTGLTVLGFYVIACAQMAAVSLIFGLDVQWWLWIVVTVLHVTGWALNTVLRKPFAGLWWLIKNIGNWLSGLFVKTAVLKHDAILYERPAGHSDGTTLKKGTRIRYWKVVEMGGLKWVVLSKKTMNAFKAEHATF